MGISFIGFRVECFFAGFGSVAGLGGKAFHECPFIVKGDLSVGGDPLSLTLKCDGGTLSPMAPFIMNECLSVFMNGGRKLIYAAFS
jgi:hypothetical protein